MSKKLLEKIKANRTRPAEIEGEEVQVRVYPEKELAALLASLNGAKDKDAAEIMSAQFEDKDGGRVFPPEFFTSDDCPQVFFAELADLFVNINYGIRKKNAPTRIG